MLIVLLSFLIALPALATKFCPNCGKEYENPDYRVCEDCGVGLLELGWVCPNCGTKVAVGYDFCPKCGEPKPGTAKPPEETKKTVNEGDTLYIIDLIDSGRYALYGDTIQYSGLTIKEGILELDGYLNVGVGDSSWRDYEISGKFFLPKTEVDDESHLRIFIHNNQREKYFGKFGRTMIFIKDGNKYIIYDLVAEESVNLRLMGGKLKGSGKGTFCNGVRTWNYDFTNDEKDRIGPVPKPEVWHDFNIVAEGFSVTLYVDGKKSVSSSNLSCDSGGFSFEPYKMKVWLKDLKVKINKMWK